MTSTHTGPALIWRAAALRLLLAVIPAWCTVAILIAAPSWHLSVIIAGVAAVTLLSPAGGLLAVTLLTPFGFLLQKFVVLQLRMSEAIVLAFLAAWLLRTAGVRRISQGPAVPPVMASAAWLLGLAIVCSVAITAARLTPFERLFMTRVLVHSYYQFGDWIGANAGMRLIEGFGLAAATVSIFRRHPSLAVRLPIALGAAASIGAVGGIWYWLDVLVRVHGLFCCPMVRIAVQTPGDLNAAGSYFAMTVFLMLGMAARARGRRGRMAWALAAALSAVGLWFTLSRTALAVAVCTFVGGLAWQARRGRLRLSIPMIVIGMVLVGALAWLAYRATYLRLYNPRNVHLQFYLTSLRMILARPVFGVGIGQYYRTSALFLSPQLAWLFGFENAHNNWLQIGAELGAIGLGLFVAWIVTSFVQAARAIAFTGDARLFGASLGALAFVGTWVSSHPLLVDEVAFPFWIQVGLMSALAGSALLNRAPAASEPIAARRDSPRWLRPRVFAAAAGVIAVSAALAWSQGPVAPPESRNVDGLSEWQTAPDGTRFRWAERYASIFVPADVVLASVPVRLPHVPQLPRTVHVYIVTERVLRAEADVSDTWTTLDVRLPDAGPLTRYKRIDLWADRTWQPALYMPGATEMRPVAIQLGEWRIVHGR